MISCLVKFALRNTHSHAAQPLEDLVTLGFSASLPGSSWIQ